jgi:HipA-like kinase
MGKCAVARSDSGPAQAVPVVSVDALDLHNDYQQGIDQVSAVKFVRSMRGGSQAKLLRCSDDHDYVVKFPNNPQGTKTLACDMLGTLLASQMGLPTQPVRLVEVSREFIQSTPQLYMEFEKGSVRCIPGICFGSRYPCAKPRPAVPAIAVVDLWQLANCDGVYNISDCAGILVFDQWTCNTDARQILFWRAFRERKWRISMIDQGSCFNGPRWNFPDSPLWGLYYGLERFVNSATLAPFELWLDRLERIIDQKTLQSSAEKMPPQWYGSDKAALDRLVERLDHRRSHVRDLIWTVLRSFKEDFLRLPSCQVMGRPARVFSTRMAAVITMKKPN